MSPSPPMLPLLLAAALGAGPVRAGEPPRADATLADLVAEALAARPELAQADAEARAARQRVPQAKALPEPMLQVSVQNDGFDQWQVGQMETSWVSVMASQTLPFPGKLGLRGGLAEAAATRQELARERVRLSTVADVRRAYLSLQLARRRLALLDRLLDLVQRSVDFAQVRYESGQGPQSDVLRGRVDVARLRQARLSLEADERLQLQALNRLRAKPVGLPIERVAAFDELRFPAPPEDGPATGWAREHSPELRGAAVERSRAEQSVELARRSYFPDVTVAAGLMLRGRLAPMWAVSVGVPLPVYAPWRQARAVSESEALLEAAGQGATAVEQLVELRVRQRLAAWRALRDVWAVYERGLLADAEAAAEATLGQYRVGAVPFTAVLDANAATLAALDGSLGVLADAWRLAIAQDEVSLADVAAGEVSMPGGGMAGAGAGGGRSVMQPARAGGGAGAEASAGGMTSSGM